MTRVLIIGAGGHAQVVAEAALQARDGGLAIEVVGFLDDNSALSSASLLGLPVLGSISDISTIRYDGVIVGIGDNRARAAISAELRHLGKRLVNVIHPTAVLAPSAQLGSGILACAGVIVNTGAVIGDGVILNTAATVDHHCSIGAHSHIAPGAHLGGNVRVGEGALIGIGATVLPGLTIGSWSVVGAGAVVTRDVPDGATVVGAPARIVQKRGTVEGSAEWGTSPATGARRTPVVEVAIYGAGGQSRVVAWAMRSAGEKGATYRVVCFIDDDEATHRTDIHGIPVMGIQAARARFPMARVVAGVGAPHLRQLVTERAAAAGYGFTTFVHPSCTISPSVEVGVGTTILPGCVVTTDVKIGKHVQIGLDCTVGHDVVIGDYTTLTPGVHIAGHVNIGQRVFMGIGSVVINGSEERPIWIGNDAVIGAGAVVTHDIPANVTAAGVPARIIKTN